MRQLKLLGLVVRCNEETLRSLESDVGLPLPEEYRTFLKTQGTGIAGPLNRFVDHRVYPHLSDSVLIDEFYTPDVLITVWREYKGRVPEPFLPIGGNDFGDFICLSLAANDCSVAYWDHEQEDLAYEIIGETPPPDRENLMKVADTFAEFIEMLGDIPEHYCPVKNPGKSGCWSRSGIIVGGGV